MKNYRLEASTIITVGFPFVAYKAIMGLIALHLLPRPVNLVLSVFLISLASVDLVMNLVNLAWLLTAQRPRTDTCSLAFLTNVVRRLLGRHNPAAWYNLGAAIDMLLSFSLVAIMVGFNLFSHLPTPLLWIWNFSTVASVLGAGTARLRSAIKSTIPLSPSPAEDTRGEPQPAYRHPLSSDTPAPPAPR